MNEQELEDAQDAPARNWAWWLLLFVDAATPSARGLRAVHVDYDPVADRVAQAAKRAEHQRGRDARRAARLAGRVNRRERLFARPGDEPVEQDNPVPGGRPAPFGLWEENVNR